MNVYDNSANNGDADEDNDESDKAPKYLVEIHEYVQTENNAGEPTGKYQLHNVVGERKKNSKPTTAKVVTSKVPIGQIALLMEKMNNVKSLPKATMKLLSYNCEVAARDRSEVFKCPGWHKFALDLGLKPMPEVDK